MVEFDHGINSSMRRLRAALNDSAERPRYIETLPKRGYRFIFPVQADQGARTGNQAAAIRLPQEHSASLKGLKWPWVALGAVALFVMVVLGLMRLRTVPYKPINSIAILPLVNTTHDPNTDYLSDGISEEIINKLSAAPHLKVIARTSR